MGFRVSILAALLLTVVLTTVVIAAPAPQQMSGLQLQAYHVEMTLRDVDRELQGLLVKARPDEVAGVVLVIRELKGLLHKERLDIEFQAKVAKERAAQQARQVKTVAPGPKVDVKVKKVEATKKKPSKKPKRKKAKRKKRKVIPPKIRKVEKK